MPESTRRDFMKTTGVAIVGASTLGLARGRAAHGANDIVTVGLAGCGGRGPGVAAAAGNCLWVCDPDQGRLANAAKKFGVEPDHAVTDLRRMLDDKSLDAVVVATPDHWHAPAALLALDAGKHVYVEKPISHNYRESQLLLDKARQTGLVVQHGTQSRSSELVAGAMQMLRQGVIGDVLMAKAWNVQRRRNIGHAQPSEPPQQLDYDTWVGPAELVPFQSNRFHYDWHWWHNFGTGDMGNDGTNGRMFVTKRGAVEVLDTKGKKVDAKPEDPPQLLSHQQDFIDAIKTSRKPNADAETAHRSVALVHLGNVACRLGRTLNLDPTAEQIVGDDEANALLARTYREGGHWAAPTDA